MVQAVYGDELGCDVKHHFLHSRDASPADARRRILQADLVYVGGGDTPRMMRLWRKLGIGEALAEAGTSGSTVARTCLPGAAVHLYRRHKNEVRVDCFENGEVLPLS